jgi:hypothetical protein
MRVKHIELQIEKLRVIELLIKNIDIESSELTAEMLIKLKEQIEQLLERDF